MRVRGIFNGDGEDKWKWSACGARCKSVCGRKDMRGGREVKK